MSENVDTKRDLEIKATWPMVGVLISGYCLLKLTKAVVRNSK